MSDNKPIIVIKKKGGHGGHHGGAWKVAYADFVTAMMAFFMVMWLLNSADSVTKKSIASYFRKPGLFEQGSGTPLLIGEAGILEDAAVPPKKGSEKYKVGQKDPTQKTDGKTTNNATIVVPIEQSTPTPTPSSSPSASPTPTPRLNLLPSHLGGTNSPDERIKWREEIVGMGAKIAQTGGKAEAEKEAGKGKDPTAQTGTVGPGSREQQPDAEKLEELAEEIRKELESTPGMKDILGLVNITVDANGLNIEIMDSDKRSMFASGSARIQYDAEAAFTKISEVLLPIQNPIEIIGHTDAKPFASRTGGYSNWELSADRANAARRFLESRGIPASRFGSVMGRADKDLKNKADPFDSTNRRISLKVRFQEEISVPVKNPKAAIDDMRRRPPPTPRPAPQSVNSAEPTPSSAEEPAPSSEEAVPPEQAEETEQKTEEHQEKDEHGAAISGVGADSFKSGAKRKKITAAESKKKNISAPDENPSPAESGGLNQRQFFGDSPIVSDPMFSN